MKELFGVEARPRSFAAGGLLAGAVLGGVLTASRFPASGNDDSHITYWAAQALSHYGRVLNYNGAPVEQSSSLLLVSLLALLDKLFGAPIPATAWLLGILAALGTLGVATKVTYELEPKAAPFVAALLGTSLPFAYWSTSGMETALTALLAYSLVEVMGADLDAQRPLRGGRLLGTLALMVGFALVRPETPALLLCTTGGAALLFALVGWKNPASDGRTRVRPALERVGAAVGSVAAVVLLRFALFHALIPNSAAAKVGGFELESGAAYLFKALTKTNVSLALVAVAGAAMLGAGLVRGRMPSRACLLLSLASALVCFIVASGGDWMPAGRLAAPLLPALAVCAAVGCARLERQFLRGIPVLALLLVGLNARALLKFGDSRENGSFTWDEARASASVAPGNPEFAFTELGNRAHRRDARLLRALLPLIDELAPTPAQPVYVMSGQAGMVPYYAFRDHFGALKFIDLFAITTRDVLACMPSSKRRAGIHGIRLDPAYIIENAERMSERCSVKRPRIVFSTGRFPDYLAELGYEKVYQGPRELEAYVAVDRRGY